MIVRSGPMMRAQAANMAKRRGRERGGFVPHWAAVHMQLFVGSAFTLLNYIYHITYGITLVLVCPYKYVLIYTEVEENLCLYFFELTGSSSRRA